MHALHSVESLLYDLMADEFHFKIRAERPPSYPMRQRIPIDEAPWMLESSAYDPPCHTDPSVLQHDCSKVEDGWADPAEFALVRDLPRIGSARYKDRDGKPLNPRGRTGLAGRGLLGLWGANLSVAALVVRTSPHSGDLEILLGGRDGSSSLEVPKGFVHPNETAEATLRRVLSQETGWEPRDGRISPVFEGYIYDPRQTDHAWVESRAFLVLPADAPSLLAPGGEFDELKWWPLSGETVNRVPSEQARFIRESVRHLMESQLMPETDADFLLASTG
jgi:ADP-ribose pyrophosphatase